jgi:hypothetical protein
MSGLSSQQQSAPRHHSTPGGERRNPFVHSVNENASVSNNRGNSRERGPKGNQGPKNTHTGPTTVDRKERKERSHVFSK